MLIRVTNLVSHLRRRHVQLKRCVRVCFCVWLSWNWFGSDFVGTGIPQTKVVRIERREFTSDTNCERVKGREETKWCLVQIVLCERVANIHTRSAFFFCIRLVRIHFIRFFSSSSRPCCRCGLVYFKKKKENANQQSIIRINVNTIEASRVGYVLTLVTSKLSGHLSSTINCSVASTLSEAAKNFSRFFELFAKSILRMDAEA